MQRPVGQEGTRGSYSEWPGLESLFVPAILTLSSSAQDIPPGHLCVCRWVNLEGDPTITIPHLETPCHPT